LASLTYFGLARFNSTNSGSGSRFGKGFLGPKVSHSIPIQPSGHRGQRKPFSHLQPEPGEPGGGWPQFRPRRGRSGTVWAGGLWAAAFPGVRIRRPGPKGEGRPGDLGQAHGAQKLNNVYSNTGGGLLGQNPVWGFPRLKGLTRAQEPLGFHRVKGVNTGPKKGWGFPRSKGSTGQENWVHA